MTGPWGPLMVAVLRRPALWPTVLRQARRVAPQGWWRRWPPSPAPPPAYVAFRLQTMYGDGQGPIAPLDLVAYLEWCRRLNGVDG